MADEMDLDPVLKKLQKLSEAAGLPTAAEESRAEAARQAALNRVKAFEAALRQNQSSSGSGLLNLPQDEPEQPARVQQSRVKAFETVLRQNPPLSVTDAPPAEEVKLKDLKDREILFRGVVYKFKPIGTDPGPNRRSGVTERWQADIHGEDGSGFNVVVDEFHDGRFTPWTFDGIFFTDFVQAAIVGVVTGSCQSNWYQEKWRHDKTRKTFIVFVLPAVAVIALLTGVVLGLK